MAPMFYDNDPVGLTEATKRYEKYRNLDPYPQIKPSLLNAADIALYARQVGLIHKFEREERTKRKTASYAGQVGCRIFQWDADNPDQDGLNQSYIRDLVPDEEFDLKRFSMVFVETEETFLLPHYIAARFNLQIELVHKGLLLGTGPLVDPGYNGKLLIPLHNLTSNDYKLARGDAFIWIEFTKTSEHPDWKIEDIEEVENSEVESLVPFKWDKRVDAAELIKKALHGRKREQLKYSKVVSGIPDSLREIDKRSRNAEDFSQRAKEFSKNQAEETKSFLTRISWIAGITAAIAFVAIFVSLAGTYIEMRTSLQSMNQELHTSLQGLNNSLKLAVENLKHEMADRIDFIAKTDSDKADSLSQRIDALYKEVNIELRRILTESERPDDRDNKKNPSPNNSGNKE